MLWYGADKGGALARSKACREKGSILTHSSSGSSSGLRLVGGSAVTFSSSSALRLVGDEADALAAATSVGVDAEGGEGQQAA